MNDNSGYEIELLPVGNGDKSGDAIALRYRIAEEYKVMVIDGGTLDSGEQLVEHINDHYETNTVDYMLSTHPDNDHSSGLRKVMEHMAVRELWIHRPWQYSSHVHEFVRDGRVTHKSLTENIQKSLNTAHTLEKMAQERGIPIFEPFQGSQVGIFEVLSPSVEFYKAKLIEEYGDDEDWLGKALREFFVEPLIAGKEALAELIGETWGLETLREGGKTSPLNETSVVLFGTVNGRGILTTGDAGIQGLTHAMDYAEYSMLPLEELRFMQIPHHGSRRNVSPSLLNRLIGEPLAEGETRDSNLSACVSASKNSKTHPRKQVTNAFIRRGAVVTGTMGETIRYSNNMPERDGWGPADRIPFYTEVESYENESSKILVPA